MFNTVNNMLDKIKLKLGSDQATSYMVKIIHYKPKNTLGPLINHTIIFFEAIKSNLEEDVRFNIEVTINYWNVNMAVHQLNKILYQSRYTAEAMNKTVDVLIGDSEEEDIQIEVLFNMVSDVFKMHHRVNNGN